MKQLDITEVLRTGFSIVSRNFLTFFVVAASIGVPLHLFVTLVQGLVGPKDPKTTDPTALLGGAAVSIVLALFSIVIQSLVQGALFHGVLADLRGGKSTVGQCFSGSFAALGTLLATSIVMTLGITVWSMLCLVPGILFAIRTSVSIPAALAEKLDPFQAMKRSTFLTLGHRWAIFGIYLIVMVGTLVIVGLLGYVLRPILVGSNAIEATKQAFVLSPGLVGFELFQAVLTSALSTVNAAIFGVLYARLRFAREGADVEQIASVFA